MRKISSIPNTTVDADYPDGAIKDENGGTGTALVAALHNDFFQFFQRLMRDAVLTYNALEENETNGYQLIDALVAKIRATAASTTEKGTIEHATNAEAATATNNILAITPGTMKYAIQNGTTIRATDSLYGVTKGDLISRTVTFTGWNMDTEVTKSIAHGIASGGTVIKAVFCKINQGSGGYTLTGMGFSGDLGGNISWDDTNINLSRVTGGGFDSATFNNASGTVSIWYEE